MITLPPGCALFEGVRPEDCTRLLAAASMRDLAENEVVFRQGDPAGAAYVVAGGTGNVRAGAAGGAQKQLMVEIFRQGDLFGELAALDGTRRSAEATALGGPVHLAVLPAKAFRDALAEVPRLGANLALLLAARVRRTFTLLQDATFERLEIRLARQLLYLARRDGRPAPGGVRLGQRVNQDDLADLMGATTRSVITILNAWRADGMLRYDARTGRVTLPDPDRLVRLVEGG